MNTYKRHRCPPDITSDAVWLYYRVEGSSLILHAEYNKRVIGKLLSQASQVSSNGTGKNHSSSI